MTRSELEARLFHVTTTVTMWLASVAKRPQLSTTLHYDTRDAYAVNMVIAPESGTPVAWTFARDLLVDGTVHPAGIGDVRIFPVDGYVVIDLNSADGSARLVAPHKPVADFVAKTLRLVPQGCEGSHLDVDAETSRLLYASAARHRES